MKADVRRTLRWLQNAIDDYQVLHDKRQTWYDEDKIPYWQRSLHDSNSLYEYIPGTYLWEYHSKANLIAVNEPLNYLFDLIHSGDNTMAKAKVKKSDNNGWNLLSLDLNSIERQAFKIWFSETLVEFDSMLIESTTNGYKLSLSYSAQQDMYYATFTQTDEDARDGRSSQTSQASEPIKAIMLAMYKLLVIGKGSLVAGKPDKEEDFR